MKEHINPKQAKEITEEQFYGLFNGDIVKRKDWANYHHKKVTVGKMLEVLTEHYPRFSGADRYPTYEEGVYIWDVENYQAFELCDALWNAVKSTVVEN